MQRGAEHLARDLSEVQHEKRLVLAFRPYTASLSSTAALSLILSITTAKHPPTTDALPGWETEKLQEESRGVCVLDKELLSPSTPPPHLVFRVLLPFPYVKSVYEPCRRTILNGKMKS